MNDTRLPAGAAARAGFVLNLLAAAMAHAQDSPGTPASLPRVEVAGTAERTYGVVDASSATRLDTPLKETPVTVQVVDQQLIRDKDLRRPNELANVVAAVQPVVGYGNTPSQYFLIRGFSNRGVNFRNGYRVAEVYTPRDLANVERVEFVMGPASVLYGASQPGGAVNTITKQALDSDFTRADLSYGSFSTVRTMLDANRQFGDVAVRVNAAADRGDSWSDIESGKNALLAPVVRWKLSPDSAISYEGEFQRTTRDGWSNGLLNLPGIENFPVGTTVAEPWNRLENTNIAHRIEFSTRLDGDWSFRQGLYNAYSKRSINTASPDFTGDPVAAGYSLTSAGRVAYSQFKDNPSNRVSQTELSGMLQTGALTHRVLAGLEFSRAIFDYRGAYDFLDTVDLNTFRPGGTPEVNNPANFGSKQEARSRAAYLQDQLRWGAWRMLAGVRYERVKSSSDDTVYGGSDSQKESATSWRIGSLYQFTSDTAAYYSYSESFTPNTGARQADGDLFPAERGKQHEIGLKHTLLPGLESTVALFEIRKTNVVVADPNDPINSVANGEQRSRGFEASVTGRPMPNLRVVANFAWLDAEVTQDPDQQDAKLYGVPRQSGNIWGVWTLPQNFEVGLGVVRVGEREAAQPNLDYFKLPAYTRFDAAVYYQLGDLRLALNVDNFTDQKILNSLEGVAVQFDTPRRWTLSASKSF